MSSSEVRREAVVAFLQSGYSVPAIQKKFGISHATIFNIKKRLKVDGHVKRKSGSGAATTVSTPSLVSKIKYRIRTNPVRTMRGMARELGVSEHTVRNVVKKKLGARSLARTKKFLLSERLKALRVERCNKLLAILKKKKQVILFSDEKYFSVDQVSNSRTDRFITNLRLEDVPDHVRAVQKAKHPAQIMMFGLVASNGLKMPPVFMAKGMRMGSKEYLEEVLIPHVKPWIDANFPDATNVVFMQDGAPCHTSKVVQKWLSENINFWPKDVWPPSSPDLNPLDFSIWAYVQAKSCDQQHPNLDHLKAAVADVWNNLSVTYIRNVCKRFRPRVEAVVAAEGGYIDK